MNPQSRKLTALLAIVCIFVIGVTCSTAASAPQRPDMTGQVKNQKGEPVSNAVVVIIAAGPRSGNGVLCPSSYSDCGKKAVCDALGNYRIESLDPTMDFCLLVLAPGYAPSVNSKLIPEAGPVPFTLKPRDFSKIAPNRQVTGRIIGPDGNPVAGAILDVNGLVKGDTTHFGGFKTDDMGITDENGEYHIGGEQDFDALLVIVDAPGVAKRWAKLETGKKQLLRMKEGGAIKGRLLFHNQPLAGVKLDMATTTRHCGEHLTGFHATTDAQGRFVFDHIPSVLKFDLFGVMDSFKTAQAGLLRNIDSPANGQPLNLGDIEAKPAHRIVGHIVLSDGKPVPPGTRIRISREEAWDNVVVQIDRDGAFDVSGIPEEQISIGLSIDGYRFSEKNPSLDSNHRGLMGRVVGDISDLTILLEPGKPVAYEGIERLSYEEQKKRSAMPLRGVQ